MAVEKDWRNTEFVVQHNFSVCGETSDLLMGKEGVSKSFIDILETWPNNRPVALKEVMLLLSDN